MPRQTFFDANLPDEEHKVRLGGVLLRFGRGGVLADPTAEQVEVMTADPYRRQRFLEGQQPRSPQQGKAADKPAGGVASRLPSPAGDQSKEAPAPTGLAAGTAEKETPKTKDDE